MDLLNSVVGTVDSFVWGPVMLILLVGTGVFLTFKLRFRTWRNLGYALRSVLGSESRKTTRGTGDVSPFSALMTALAATIGTGNIVGVATAMFAGGPGALVWMWISACFGLTTKFSECMLSIKYRTVNEKGEMSGGPMYTMKRGFKNKRFGSALGWLFALFATLASFGIGNLSQANSISNALKTSFGIPLSVCGIVLTVLTLIIVIGGIKSISRVSSVVVPCMAVFYVIAGIIVIIINHRNLPSGLYMIFTMAFNPKAVGGGVLGTITVSVMNSIRYGVSRGCFSNEAGMGSAAITAAAATTDDPVRQGYINMTGTFFDTIVVCTITGLAIASSGMLGQTGADGQALQGGNPGGFLKLQFNWVNNPGGNGMRDLYLWFYIKNIGLPFIALILALRRRDTGPRPGLEHLRYHERAHGNPEPDLADRPLRHDQGGGRALPADP